MSEDNLCSHAPKHKGHGKAEEDEVVLDHESGIGRIQPGADGERIHCHWGPFEKDGSDREVFGTTGADDVRDAEGEMCTEEGGEDYGHPEIADGGSAEEIGKGAIEKELWEDGG